MMLFMTFSSTKENTVSVLEEIPIEHILNIPTYDESSQAVHPDILYFKDSFKGHYFYMVMTPYPYSDDDYENPSILVSENGCVFYEEKDSLNPLVEIPAYGYNNDPDIFFNNGTNEFYIHYLETMRPDSQNLILLKSSDGIEWYKSTAVRYDFNSGDDFIISPTMVMKDNTYYLFYVNKFLVGRPIQYYTSPSGIVWDKNFINDISIHFPEGFTPWHLDVFAGNQQYYMLCNGYFDDFNNQNLYMATSSDLINWHVGDEPILKNSPSFYNSRRIYRSTGVVDGNLLVVWFSFLTFDNEWKIGVKKYYLRSSNEGFHIPIPAQQ